MNPVPATLRLPDGRLVGTLTELRPHVASEPKNSGIFATFEAGPHFDVVRDDLAFVDECIQDQTLSVLDDAEDRVLRHGLRLRRPGGSSRALGQVHLHEQEVFFRFLPLGDLVELIPDGKHDLDTVARAVEAGFPAVEPILSDLLECIQDRNWPIAQEIWPFLTSLGVPLAPHIEAVFEGSDDGWKYWCVSLVGGLDSEAQQLLLPALTRIVEHPTPGEIKEEVALEARELLERLLG